MFLLHDFLQRRNRCFSSVERLRVSQPEVALKSLGTNRLAQEVLSGQRPTSLLLTALVATHNPQNISDLPHLLRTTDVEISPD